MPRNLPYHGSIIEALDGLDFANPLLTERVLALSELAAGTHVPPDYRDDVVKTLGDVRRKLCELQKRSGPRRDRAITKAIVSADKAIQAIGKQLENPARVSMSSRRPRPSSGLNGDGPSAGHI